MKLFFILSVIIAFNYAHDLTNSVWVYRVSGGGLDKLNFISNTKVEDYDCELNYTFHDNYLISKDTLIINEKDNSHSEDGDKLEIYCFRFLIQDKILRPISNQRFVNGKWENMKGITDKKYFYQKISS